MQNSRNARITGAFVLGAFGFLTACADADRTDLDTVGTSPATATTPGIGEAAWTDANVVDALVTANQGEVEYSQIAVERATNPQVKEYAQTMVRDHGALVEKLNGLASQLGVTPAPNDRTNDLREENQKDMTDLSAKGGEDFDDEFIEEQIDMHQEMLDLLDDLDNRTTNAEVKAHIAQVRPNVQAHLDRAKQIKDNMD